MMRILQAALGEYLNDNKNVPNELLHYCKNRSSSQETDKQSKSDSAATSDDSSKCRLREAALIAMPRIEQVIYSLNMKESRQPRQIWQQYTPSNLLCLAVLSKMKSIAATDGDDGRTGLLSTLWPADSLRRLNDLLAEQFEDIPQRDVSRRALEEAAMTRILQVFYFVAFEERDRVNEEK